MELAILFIAIGGLLWLIWLGRTTGTVVHLGCVLLVGAVFGPHFFSQSVGPIPVTIDRVLLFIVFVHSCFLIAWQRRINFKFTRLDAVVVALCLYLTASTFLTDWKFRENLPMARLLFYNYLPIAIYFIARNADFSLKDVKVLLIGMTLFGFYLSATSIMEVKGPSSLIFPSYIKSTEFVEFLGRGRGPFLNPVACGVYQIVCLVAAMMLWPHLKNNGKAILICMAPVFMAGVFFTLTRGVWLAAAISVFLVMWIPANIKQRSLMMAAGMMVMVVFLGFFSDKLQGFKRDKNVTAYEMSQSAGLRPLLATVALKMAQDRPVFGCGFGQYSKHKIDYHFDSDKQPLRKVMPYMQHNVFLNYLCELGMVGVLLLLALLVGFMRSAWAAWRNPHCSLWHKQIGLVALASIVGYLVNGMFQDVSIIDTMGALFFLFGALSVNCAQKQAIESAVEPGFEPAQAEFAQEFAQDFGTDFGEAHLA